MLLSYLSYLFRRRLLFEESQLLEDCRPTQVFSFYPHKAMLACYLPSLCVCLSVYLSVHLSDTSRCVLLRWLNLGSCKQRHVIDHRL